ncbi:transcriptional regulator [Ammoniphilus oxalaticus]|uniref:Transcriptional regulator n=2 Tax=Ammoniphilus oxalaticus TaxID=66863 RepID=A0A419SMX1_9BACL|nr:transcriptional regulator [Ammoniphilus oxalaticus]
MDLIQTERSLRTAELSERFNVSEMTIYRDIKPLIEQGLVMKTFGGIALMQNEREVRGSQECVVCYRTINERLSYRLILPNNRIDSACCAHCGLIFHKEYEDDVIQALCYDFLLQTTISAPLAWYVLDTSLDMQCCQPQALAFGRISDAEKFVKGFGGRVCSFEEATREVTRTEGCCKHGK